MTQAITPTASQEQLDSIETWKLKDWIENIKSWPDLDDQFKKYRYRKKRGHQKVAHLLRDKLYQGLSIHLEYQLLHRRELETQIYSEPLLGLMPHASLMVASHDFITRHWWPKIARIGCTWNWIPDADFMWGLFEYSLCFKNYKKIVEGKNSRSAKFLRTQLGEIVNRQKDWLEDPSCPQQVLKSSIFEQAISKADQEAERQKLVKDWKVFFDEIRQDLTANFYKLVLIEAHLFVLSEPDDEPFQKAYQNYWDAWDAYRAQINPAYHQIIYLLNPDSEPVLGGMVGRPPKETGHTKKRGRGRPPKGFQFHL
jgi:hypothetical protein